MKPAVPMLRHALTVALARRRIIAIPDPVIDEICSTLRDGLGCASTFVTFVTAKRAFMVGGKGVPAEALDPEGMPLVNSFCYHLLTTDADGLVVDNTREFPLLDLCPSTASYGAWVGAPVTFKGVPIGAVGGAEAEPRHWPASSLATVQKAAQRVEQKLAR